MDKSLSAGEIKSMQPLALAFLGDAIYEIYIREYIMAKGYRTINALHRETIKFVRAKSQCKAVKKIISQLTSEEESVVRRGRNANPHTVPKNADVEDYRYATALESLLGYLHLYGEKERLEQLIDLIINAIEEDYH